MLLGAIAGLAGVALALGQSERAVRLLSAVEAIRATSGLGRYTHAGHTARILAEVRTSLPESVFVAAWDEGRSSRSLTRSRTPSRSLHPLGSHHNPCPVKPQPG